jgi:hypothetical protein
MGTNDGGAAFPSDHSVKCRGEYSDGMTLRDYFAAAYIPTPRDTEYADRHDNPGAIIAQIKLDHADAMLAVREVKQ